MLSFSFLVIATLTTTTNAFQPSSSLQQQIHRAGGGNTKLLSPFRRISSSTSSSSSLSAEASATSSLFSEPCVGEPLSIEEAVENRYACTRFRRYAEREDLSEFDDDEPVGTRGNPVVLRKAREIIDLARRAPSGFNVQPYKVILVETPEAKEEMARWCPGRNADRVLDSDVTAVFLADRQSVNLALGTMYKKCLYNRGLDENMNWKERLNVWKTVITLTLFTGGIGFPKIMTMWVFPWMRFGMRFLSWFTRSIFPLPTLTSNEAWSQKHTIPVAMSYILLASANRMATCPMEGYNVWGVRQALHIPRRYTIPMVLCTGSPYKYDKEDEEETDDVGLSHAEPTTTPRKKGGGGTKRFPFKEMVFLNYFEHQYFADVKDY